MKLKEFQHYLKEHHIDLAFLVHPDINLTYFTGLKISYGYLAISPTKAVLFHTQLDTPPTIKNITKKLLQKSWEKSLPGRRPKVVGINKEVLTLAELNHKTLKAEQDVALFLEKKMREQGGEIGFPTIIAMGKNAATPHHVTSLAPLHKGFLLFDFGASYNHYCADMSRTVYLGSPSVSEREIYTLLQQSQQAPIKGVAEGKALLDLDKIARKILGKQATRFIHSLGHGIGLEVHEAPSFVKEVKVQQNVPFTIEPGVYFPGKFGIRIEDTLYWDGKRVCVLTQFTKDLIVLPTF